MRTVEPLIIAPVVLVFHAARDVGFGIYVILLSSAAGSASPARSTIVVVTVIVSFNIVSVPSSVTVATTSYIYRRSAVAL